MERFIIQTPMQHLAFTLMWLFIGICVGVIGTLAQQAINKYWQMRDTRCDDCLPLTKEEAISELYTEDLP